MNFADKLHRIARDIDRAETVEASEPQGILYDVWLRSVPVVKNKPVVMNVTHEEALVWKHKLTAMYKKKQIYIDIDGTNIRIQFFIEIIMKGESIDIFWNPKQITIGDTGYEQN